MYLSQLKNIKLSYFELMCSLSDFFTKKQRVGQYEVREDIVKMLVKRFDKNGVIQTLKVLDSVGNIAFSQMTLSSITSFICNFEGEARLQAIKLPFIAESLKSLPLDIEELRQVSVAYFNEEHRIELLKYFDSIGILNFENEDDASLKDFIILFADKETEFSDLMGFTSLRQTLEKQLKQYPIKYFIPNCLKDSPVVDEIIDNLFPKAATASQLTQNGMFRSVAAISNGITESQNDITFTKK
jgi:hypothetical protein